MPNRPRMSRKKIMILGAGKNEIPAVVKAKSRGLETVVVDMNPRAPALEFADRAVVPKTTKTEEYVGIAVKERIDGVMTVSAEALVRKVSAIANAMGLPGISAEMALIATDKSVMRSVFHEKGIPSPRFIRASGLGEAEKGIEGLSMPLVIKPLDQAGSRGVFKINDKDELRHCFDISKNISRCGGVIIEEFIDGIHSTVDAITANGKTHILGISDKVNILTPNIIVMDVAFPPAYPAAMVREVDRLVCSMLEKIGFDYGHSHTEVVVADDGPSVIEFAARSGGGLLPSDILPHLCGFDVIDKLISLALGEDLGIGNVTLSNGADLRFFNSPLGRLKKIHGVEEAMKVKGVHKLDFIVKEGDLIKPLTEGKERVGFVITYGNDREEAVRSADEVERLIKFETDAASTERKPGRQPGRAS